MRFFKCFKKNKVQDNDVCMTISEVLANRRNEIVSDDKVLHRHKKYYSNKMFAAIRTAKENGHLTAGQIEALKDCFENGDVGEIIKANNIRIVRASI